MHGGSIQQAMQLATLLPVASCTLKCIRDLCNASCPNCNSSPGRWHSNWRPAQQLGRAVLPPQTAYLSCAWLCRRCRPGWPLTRLKSWAFTRWLALQALQTGAASYLTPEQRFQMGIVRPSHRDEAADHSHALRFTAYERTAAPAAAAGQAAGGRGSPAFGQRDTLVSQAGDLCLGQHRGDVDGSDAEVLHPADSCVRAASGVLLSGAQTESTSPLKAAGACCRTACQRETSNDHENVVCSSNIRHIHAGSAAATMPAPAAAPLAPAAPADNEPQLRTGGARRWGPASFNAAPAAAPAASGAPRAAGEDFLLSLPRSGHGGQDGCDKLCGRFTGAYI